MCSQSMTFPRRAPGPEDELERRRGTRIAAGERHRKLTTVEVEASPPAPLMLICHCCRQILPWENFYANNSPTARNRGYRAWRCRRCTSFRLRVRRELDPEGTKRRGREQRARYAAGMTPGQRESEKQRRTKTKEATNAASRRYQARRRGTPVPLQRSGRLPVFIKPICRISEGCPLRRFCTIENKGLA